MFNDSYEIEPKGIPLVSYFKELKVEVPPKIFTEMHYHSDFEILYITGGRAKMMVNTDVFYAEKNSMILINPYELHYGEVLSEFFSYFCIDFNMDLLLLENKDKIISGNMKFKNHIKSEDMKLFIQNVFSSYQKAREGWKLSAIGNLHLLFSHLEKELRTSASVKENEFAKKVLNYINENYTKNISSKTASQELSYNQSYFCRMFHKNFSLKFSEYLNIYRIKKAKEFLKEQSVSEVAMNCGFSSISYFSLEFKKRCGVSPTEFKRQMIKPEKIQKT